MHESTTLIKDNYVIKDTFPKKKLKLIFQEITHHNNYSIVVVFILTKDIPNFHFIENEFNHQYRDISRG